MSEPFKICIQRAETRQEWDAMQDDYINRAVAAADRIEKLEAKNKKMQNGLWSIIRLCKWGIDRTPFMCAEGEYCTCIKAFNALDYDLSNSFDD